VKPGKPTFFKKQSDLRSWLSKNHDAKSELWIGLYRAKAASKGVVYKQALDEALCFGWIDGVRKGIDDETWMIRFTPRKKGSIWSRVNLKRAEELIASGAMAPAGRRVYDERDMKKAGTSYSFENEPLHLTDDMEMGFRTHGKAWKWFVAQAPSYQKVAVYWVMSAKKQETRDKRLGELIADSAKGQRVKPLREYPRKK
jgi:uncharacterized protein YdeI (YjbR/CyaY-like superfamily)